MTKHNGLTRTAIVEYAICTEALCSLRICSLRSSSQTKRLSMKYCNMHIDVSLYSQTIWRSKGKSHLLPGSTLFIIQTANKQWKVPKTATTDGACVCLPIVSPAYLSCYTHTPSLTSRLSDADAVKHTQSNNLNFLRSLHGATQFPKPFIKMMRDLMLW